MKTDLRFLVLLSVIFSSHGAYASSAYLSFDGMFDRISYAPCLTQLASGACSEFDSSSDIDVTTLFQGIPLSVGDLFQGAFSYSSDDGFVFSDNGTLVDYRSVISNVMFSTGLLELPRPELEIAFWDLGNYVAVVNDSASGDGISVLQNFYSENWRGLFTVNLSDFSGQVFSDTSLPTEFELSNFSWVTFRLNIEHTGGNGDRVDIFGNINNLEVAPIPVPPAFLLFLSAFGSLLFASKRTGK